MRNRSTSDEGRTPDLQPSRCSSTSVRPTRDARDPAVPGDAGRETILDLEPEFGYSTAVREESEASTWTQVVRTRPAELRLAADEQRRVRDGGGEAVRHRDHGAVKYVRVIISELSGSSTTWSASGRTWSTSAR